MIFNVGDYIVLSKEYDSRPMPVALIIDQDENDYICEGGGFVDKAFAHMWRLATPDEVAAGHRLD